MKHMNSHIYIQIQLGVRRGKAFLLALALFLLLPRPLLRCPLLLVALSLARGLSNVILRNSAHALFASPKPFPKNNLTPRASENY